MKKIKHFFPLVFLISFLFISCNKDEDITIENPDSVNPENPSASLGYSVIEYIPAPGQYINEAVSGFDNITTQEEACRQAEKRLQGNLYVSLGNFGGYIVVKFDKRIPNSGDYDFSIGCNAFDSSNEPGIVWVMKDENNNGIPDETWYELKGSYYEKPGYEKDYQVTYFRPSNPREDIRWIDSNSDEGVITWMGNYHSQDFYYPAWVKTDSYTLGGTRLPLMAERNELTGIWTNLPFDWGYADNKGNDFNPDNNRNYFKISNAIDSAGEPISLESVDFIKVQTAVNGQSGWLGENSTEVCGFFIE